MRLISVNLGAPQLLSGRTYKTGIYKTSTDQPVRIEPLGLVGDAILNTKHHGGVDQAVYLYGTADYDWWADQLGHELLPGTFGENLTISELQSATHNIGDRFRIGDVLLEVTSPRIPCGTLAARMDDDEFAERFRLAQRPGLYCRVIEPGSVKAGQEVKLERFTGTTISSIEMFHLYYEKWPNVALLQRAVAAPVSQKAKRKYAELLEKLKR